MSKLSESDIQFYGKAIKEIGEVALKHANNNPAGAEFLLVVTQKIMQKSDGLSPEDFEKIKKESDSVHAKT